jgi:DNA-binding IscR family transcriptional regulator
MNKDACSRKKFCTVREKLIEIQKSMTGRLASITLDELIREHRDNINTGGRKRRKR